MKIRALHTSLENLHTSAIFLTGISNTKVSVKIYKQGALICGKVGGKRVSKLLSYYCFHMLKRKKMYLGVLLPSMVSRRHPGTMNITQLGYQHIKRASLKLSSQPQKLPEAFFSPKHLFRPDLSDIK